MIEEEVCTTEDKCETVIDTECRRVTDQVCQDVSVPGEALSSQMSKGSFIKSLSSNFLCISFSSLEVEVAK